VLKNSVLFLLLIHVISRVEIGQSLGTSENEILGCAGGLSKDDERQEEEEWNCYIVRSLSICVLFMAGVA
jgi:hypothetical protein